MTPIIALQCLTLGNLGVITIAVLANSSMGEAFENNAINVPQSREINDSTGDVPYFLVGDEIFPLKKWLMRPYPGTSLSEEENKIYNYRHSRARRVIENAFGILCTRWRIFHKPIKATVANVENYTLACLTLHNYLRQTDNSMYTPQGFVDSRSSNGQIKEGEWRLLIEKREQCIS